MTFEEEAKMISKLPAKLTVESRGGGTTVEMAGEARKLAWMLTKAFGSILRQLPDEDSVAALAYATKIAIDKEAENRMAMFKGEKEPFPFGKDVEPGSVIEVPAINTDGGCDLTDLLDEILDKMMNKLNGS